jgi:hypothetical protein
MAETIFAGKKIKKFACEYRFGGFAFIGTIFSRFSKHFFFSYGPSDAGNGYC